MHGIPHSRAYRMTASVLARLLYGLPGRIHSAENPLSASTERPAVETHVGSTSTRSALALCAQAAIVAWCGANTGSYSPINAMRIAAGGGLNRRAVVGPSC